MAGSNKSSLSLGFISVRHHAEHGYFGGYLIVNQLGRPLEFHCTLPVKPSRAQELLYGATLDAFICGEQIAKALVTKAKLKSQLLLTDCSAVLAYENVGDEPIIYLDTRDFGSEPSHLRRPSDANVELRRLSGGEANCYATGSGSVTESIVANIQSQLAPNFDLAEPFQRIAEALLEAHPIAKAA